MVSGLNSRVPPKRAIAGVCVDEKSTERARTLSFEDRVRITSDPQAAAQKAAEMIETMAEQIHEWHRLVSNQEMAIRARSALRFGKQDVALAGCANLD